MCSSAALVKMGAPVTSGITLTKFAGVVVLAFARTQIFEVGVRNGQLCACRVRVGALKGVLQSFRLVWACVSMCSSAALIKMGALVTSGITLTKFAGVVLAFACTQIFEVRCCVLLSCITIA
jgi:hypothetical protein